MHHSKRENNSKRGFLAQLVQSIWFTPRGSGVRIPQDPQKVRNPLKIRVLSSVGSEHLVYTQRVGGSNPSGPTKTLRKLRVFYALTSPFPIYNLLKVFLDFLRIRIKTPNFLGVLLISLFYLLPVVF